MIQFTIGISCFSKKSKKGAKTLKQDIDLIKSRLKTAAVRYVEGRKKTWGVEVHDDDILAIMIQTIEVRTT